MLKTRYKLPDSILFTKSNHMNGDYLSDFFLSKYLENSMIIEIKTALFKLNKENVNDFQFFNNYSALFYFYY